jgi:DNA repair ATPase RecN
MSRKRYELSFDEALDADHIALIEERRASGHAVVDTVRAALATLTQDDGDSSQAQIAELSARLEQLERAHETIDRLARKVENLEARLEAAQFSEVATVPDEVDVDQARHDALSSKLKGISFAGLTH